MCENISICGMRMPPTPPRHKGHICPRQCAAFLTAIVLQRRPLTSVTNLLTFRFLQRDSGQRRRYTCRRRPGGRTQTQAASVSPPTMATVWCRDGGWRRQQTKVDRKWRTRLMGLAWEDKVKNNSIINRGRCSELVLNQAAAHADWLYWVKNRTQTGWAWFRHVW